MTNPNAAAVTMTKRERMALEIAKGLAANPNLASAEPFEIAGWAADTADELINILTQPTEETEA
jgi:hypothetical protein